MKEKNILVASLRRIQKVIEKPLRLKVLPYCYDYPVSPYMRVHYHRDVFEQANLSFQTMIRQAMDGTFDEDSFSQAMHMLSLDEDLENPIILDRPFSSVAQVVLHEDGNKESHNPYFDVQEIVPDWFVKLSGLYQYSIPVQTISSSGDTVALFTHNRNMHSVDVAINMEIVLRLNQCDERIVQQGILTGLLHDVSTPLFGDITMMSFPDLAEEKTFGVYMHRKGNLPLLQQRYGLDTDTMTQWIQNQGLMGELLDICDRLGYTMRDSYYYGTDTFLSRETSQDDEDASLRNQSFLMPIMHVDPLLFDIITEMRIMEFEGNKRVVCMNPDRLARVLFQRAHMITDLYKNPYNWGRELYMGKVLEFLVDKGVITKEDLSYDRSPHNIEDAIRQLQIENEIPQDPLSIAQDFFYCELFDTMEGAKQKIAVMRRNYGEQIPCFIIPFTGFESGTEYLVYDQDRKEICTLEKSRPHAHAFLEQAKEFSKYVALYFPRRRYQEKSVQPFVAFLNKQSRKMLNQQ